MLKTRLAWSFLETKRSREEACGMELVGACARKLVPTRRHRTNAVGSSLSHKARVVIRDKGYYFRGYG